MNSNGCIKTNTPSIASENVDGEVIILNMDNGNYYSTVKVGANIWELIEGQRSCDEIVEIISYNYNGEKEEIKTSIQKFIAELSSEKLIVFLDGNQGESNRIEGIEKVMDKLDFKMPVLEKYSDMKDLLLLDPIHEVNNAGWPSSNTED